MLRKDGNNKLSKHFSFYLNIIKLKEGKQLE